VGYKDFAPTALAVSHDSALEIRDEVGFFQEVRAVLAKSISEGGGKSPEELELAVRQIVSRKGVSLRLKCGWHQIKLRLREEKVEF
jgi:hypothetical protein